MTKALIVGCDGQDGRLLRDSLSQKGYEVLGIDRRDSTATKADWRLDVDIGDPGQVRDAIASTRPDQVYYLAAVHGSSESAQDGDQSELLSRSLAVNVESLSYFLESIRTKSPESRLFYAASSHVFGDEAATSPQDEDTPFHPTSIYGITKAAGVETCRYFRERFGIFASCGILYNHESVYRGTGFLTRKILDAVRAIKEGRATRLVLGSLDAEADWGYAPDFVEAFQKILQASAPDDFVVATGIKHTVREFVGLAFDALGLDWTKYVEVDAGIVGKERNCLVGNPRKLKKVTGWAPSLTFEGMVTEMLKSQGERIDGR